MTKMEFGRMVQSEAVSLRHYAYQLTRDMEDANDLMQETLLKALANHGHFADGSNLKGWLLIIMRNSFINNYRRMQRRRALIESTDNIYFLEAFGPMVQNGAIGRFIMKDLEAAVSSLPHDLKKAFMLYFNGFKYHEIAEKVNVPIGTVKTRIFSARRLLRQKLGSYAAEYETAKELKN